MWPGLHTLTGGEGRFVIYRHLVDSVCVCSVAHTGGVSGLNSVLALYSILDSRGSNNKWQTKQWISQAAQAVAGLPLVPGWEAGKLTEKLCKIHYRVS